MRLYRFYRKLAITGDCHAATPALPVHLHCTCGLPALRKRSAAHVCRPSRPVGLAARLCLRTQVQANGVQVSHRRPQDRSADARGIPAAVAGGAREEHPASTPGQASGGSQ